MFLIIEIEKAIDFKWANSLILIIWHGCGPCSSQVSSIESILQRSEELHFFNKKKDSLNNFLDQLQLALDGKNDIVSLTNTSEDLEVDTQKQTKWWEKFKIIIFIKLQMCKLKFLNVQNGAPFWPWPSAGVDENCSTLFATGDQWLCQSRAGFWL